MRGAEFAELKAFAAIVERASFARAPDHLGLSPSALSQTIRQLEARLGVRLLNRTTRSVAPTASGSRLHERIAPMIEEMDAAVTEAVAGIRVGEHLEKDMIAVRLTPDVQMLAVASPDYLARRGEPKTPADLHRHACINWRFPGSGAIYRWSLAKKGKRIELAVDGPLISNLQEVVLEGALQGIGISYAYDADRISAAGAGAH